MKQTGDGVLAIFDGPARAVQCASTIGRLSAIGTADSAGLHTGEVERRGDDVSGVAVHLAQRVQGGAEAAVEIRVSRTVVDLVAGSDLRFEDKGEHELKGVPGPWRLFAVSG